MFESLASIESAALQQSDMKTVWNKDLSYRRSTMAYNNRIRTLSFQKPGDFLAYLIIVKLPPLSFFIYSW
jgi:hypothetical protein